MRKVGAASKQQGVTLKHLIPGSSVRTFTESAHAIAGMFSNR